MKNLLRYGRHLLHAKGRHGTHSPFVYAFVENVLRNKKRFHLNAGRKLSRKEINLLIRIIHFLKPHKILVDKELLNLLSSINLLPDTESITVSELNEHHIVQLADEKTLLISGSAITNMELLKTAIEQSIVSVLVINPHINKLSEENWHALSALPEVRMRLDLWHVGLLLNDPAFKASQYFRLR